MSSGSGSRYDGGASCGRLLWTYAYSKLHGTAMVKATGIVITKETVAGVAVLYKVPVESPADFECNPRDVLSYADFEAIGNDLAANITSGKGQEYKWSKITEW